MNLNGVEFNDYFVIYRNNYGEIRTRILDCGQREDAEDVCRALGLKEVLVLCSLRKCVMTLGENNKRKEEK